MQLQPPSPIQQHAALTAPSHLKPQLQPHAGATSAASHSPLHRLRCEPVSAVLLLPAEPAGLTSTQGATVRPSCRWAVVVECWHAAHPTPRQHLHHGRPQAPQAVQEGELSTVHPSPLRPLCLTQGEAGEAAVPAVHAVCLQFAGPSQAPPLSGCWRGLCGPGQQRGPGASSPHRQLQLRAWVPVPTRGGGWWDYHPQLHSKLWWYFHWRSPAPRHAATV